MSGNDESGAADPAAELVRVTERLHRVEGELQSLLQHIPAFVYRVRLDGTISFINRVPAPLRPADAVGRPVSAFLAPEDRGRYEQAFAAVVREGQRRDLEVCGTGDHGQMRTYAAHLSPVMENGRVTEVLGVCFDIHTRKQLEVRARENEELIRSTLSAVPAGIVQVRSDGAILLANPIAERLLGLSWDDIRRMYVRDFETWTLHDDGSPCPAEEYPVAQCLATGKPAGPATIGVKRQDGSVAWAVFSAVPLAPQPDGKPAGAVVTFLDITERKRAESQLGESQRQMASLMANLPGLVYRCKNDPDWTMVFLNEHCRVLTGYVPDEIRRGRPHYADLILPEDRQRVWDEVQAAVSQRKPYVLEYRILTRDKVIKHVWERGEGVFAADGSLVALEGVITDVSERRALEGRRAEAQRMESIGRLAGGVAHDFNNLLTAILGFAELAAAGLPDGVPAQDDLKSIRGVAQRGAALIRQLRAFARRQRVQPQNFHVHELMRRSERILRQLLDENIELHVQMSAQADLVRADPGLIEQVLINLVLNARDAMPAGGRLTLRTENAIVGADEARMTPDAAPGAYLLLTVQDTGAGMSDEVLRHVFEPFFTTKGPNRGTGLGLASCYGIVRQNGGHIRVSSKAGAGASFRVYLPRGEGAALEFDDAVGVPGDVRGSETILVAEDEPQVRLATTRMLSDQGYRVLAGENGEDALARARSHDGPIDLLVTDVVMPRMGGVELADRLRQERPGLRVLFVSGYVDRDRDEPEPSRVPGEFMQKPYLPSDLLKRVRGLLDAQRA